CVFTKFVWLIMCRKEDIILLSQKEKNIPMLFFMKFVWHPHYTTPFPFCKDKRRKNCLAGEKMT
ncbi:MAG: hypothetical protein IKC73_03360, partial [Clostridia bacterium]|nr:hypothetical protein [Clostridia bacterium]